MDAHQLAALIKQKTLALQFDLVGIAPASASAYREYLRQWLDDGQHGTMAWLAGRFEERTDPGVYLPGAASVICAAVSYKQSSEQEETRPFMGRIARYARGEDYHELLKGRLHELADFIRREAPEVQTRVCVDTAPVMEKELAQRAGLGWVGKNTLVIHPRIGSWTLLGEVITTAALPFDRPGVDRCGTCRRCLDACPTGALSRPYQLDARKCISYLTIENRGVIAEELKAGIGQWLFGCDICQEVCPWNHKAPLGNDLHFASRFPDGELDVRELAGWTAEEYRTRLKRNSMKRIKLPILQRNANIVMDNTVAEAAHGSDV